MQNQEDQRKTESEMPVDAVEHQLTPIIQKNLIPDQKGVVSPFAPADNGLTQSSYDSESGFEVKESDITMQGPINPNNMDQYLQDLDRKELKILKIEMIYNSI